MLALSATVRRGARDTIGACGNSNRARGNARDCAHGRGRRRRNGCGLGVDRPAIALIRVAIGKWVLSCSLIVAVLDARTRHGSDSAWGEAMFSKGRRGRGFAAGLHVVHRMP